MSLRERWKKWTRPNYECSIEELKERNKDKIIICFTLEAISISMLLFLLLLTLDMCELIITATKGFTLIVALIIFTMVMNVILLFHLEFHIDALDFARDKDYINLLIYLKQQEKYGKH